jgi:hypothetical protein
MGEKDTTGTPQQRRQGAIVSAICVDSDLGGDKFCEFTRKLL